MKNIIHAISRKAQETPLRRMALFCHNPLILFTFIRPFQIALIFLECGENSPNSRTT